MVILRNWRGLLNGKVLLALTLGIIVGGVGALTLSFRYFTYLTQNQQVWDIKGDTAWVDALEQGHVEFYIESLKTSIDCTRQALEMNGESVFGYYSDTQVEEALISAEPFKGECKPK